jgi:hypothetical protein
MATPARVSRDVIASEGLYKKMKKFSLQKGSKGAAA